MASVAEHVRDEVRGTLLRYCSSVDAADWDEVQRCYWADAVDHHGVYTGNPAGLAAHFRTSLTAYRATVHLVSEPTLEGVDESHVRSATNVLAYHWGRQGVADLVMGAVYRDVFECRDSEWRIIERVVAAIDASEHHSSGERWKYFDRFTHDVSGGTRDA